MLTKILKLLREAQGPLSVTELATQLDVDISALEGMLDQLVRQGKLLKSEEMTADECRLEHASGLYGDLCAFLTHGNSATRYEIVES
jgi:hypothetical protein